MTATEQLIVDSVMALEEGRKRGEAKLAVEALKAQAQALIGEVLSLTAVADDIYVRVERLEETLR